MDSVETTKPNDANVEDVNEIRFYLSSRHYITLSLLTTILLWAVAMTYGVTKFVVISQIEQEREDLRHKYENASSENTNLKIELQKNAEVYKNALAKESQPILLTPENNSTLIAANSIFNWTYKGHHPNQKYILEIRNFHTLAPSAKQCPLGQPTHKYTVTNPQNEGLPMPKKEFCNGEYIWRIKPGYIRQGQEILLGRRFNFPVHNIQPRLASA